MVIVQLSGGIGNQMFQYALGKHLAVKNKSELKLDMTSFAKDQLRDYALNVFKTTQTFCSQEEANGLRFGLTNPILAAITEKINRASRKFIGHSLIKTVSLVEELAYSFNPKVLEAKNDIYLQGYWQSEKYFKDIREILIQEFSIKTTEEKNTPLLNQILGCESVSLHVRRGDYVSNKKTSQTHSCCSIEYYLNSIKYIKSKIKKPVFFIFSDDPGWVEKNLRLENSFIIRGNEKEKSSEDIRLMSSCRHNIIANSSFSWWGAWLNQTPDKIIVAPQKWFNIAKFESVDRIPSSWVKL